MPQPLRLTFASGPYDRFAALHDGTVRIEGVTLDPVALWPPRLIFDRVAGKREFDIAEFSCSEFIALTDWGTNPFVAIPVFPSRVFRHGFICVRRDGPVRAPGDLEGKRVGVPLYTLTAAIWIRGLLENDYGVDLSRIRWVQGNVMQPGAHGDPSASPMRHPPEIEINESDKSLAELLVAGEIDAILGTFVDEAVNSHPDIVRLFPDYRARERDYFRRTGVFPIMHLMTIRRDVHEAHPWLAPRLFRACEAGQGCGAREACLAEWPARDAAVAARRPWRGRAAVRRRRLALRTRAQSHGARDADALHAPAGLHRPADPGGRAVRGDRRRGFLKKNARRGAGRGRGGIGGAEGGRTRFTLRDQTKTDPLVPFAGLGGSPGTCR